MKDLNLLEKSAPLKGRCQVQLGVLVGVLLTPVMGSRTEAPKSLSYTAFWQARNSLCKKERQLQLQTIIKTLP